MYTALVGELPVPYRGDDFDYIRRLQTVDIADIGDARPDLDAEQQELVRRCLHPQPARRFRNAGRLRDALEVLT
jgi:serine/threonine-protein kinase